MAMTASDDFAQRIRRPARYRSAFPFLSVNFTFALFHEAVSVSDWLI